MRELTAEEKAILDQHTKWLESNGEYGTRANLHNADLCDADLRNAGLREADLCDADLRGANLREVDLRGGNLRDADLREADLRGANLRGANLCEADLRWAHLCDADLHNADLRGADLREVDLHGADLRRADLDFSSWPLWCGSRGVKTDDRLVAQLIWHVTRLDVSGCSGGVQEAVENIRSMAIADLFCEYRSDLS